MDDPVEETVGLGADHYKAIGQVAISWSFMELIIDAQTWKYAELDETLGACLTAQIAGSGRKLDALFALIRCRFKPSDKLEGRFNKFSEATTGLAERRNRVIHDPWIKFAKDDKSRRIQITAKKRLVFDTVEHPTQDIFKLGKDIHRHADAFKAIMEAADLELAAWREKNP